MFKLKISFDMTKSTTIVEEHSSCSIYCHIHGVSHGDGNGSESMMVPETYHQSTQPDFVLTSDAGEEALIDHNMTLPEDGDSALGGSTSPEPFGKSQCSSMSDGESFECYGEGVVMDELDPESPPSRHSNISNGERERRSMSLNRNTWHRSSLRGSKSSHHDNISHRRSGSFRHSGKRLGSNALASQLYRSSSFNSSGRSSNCDTAEDIYSDISLEEDVLDLNHKVQMLQQQVNILADNQNDTDDRYTRAKQDNAALQARVLMLEEQLRDCELRSQERLDEEQRRHRELMVRVDREKQLQLENCNIRLQTLELEGASLRDETLRLHAQLEKLRCEKLMLEEKLNEADTKITVLAEENRQLQEADKRVKDDAARQRKIDFQIVEELNREVEILKAEKGEEQHQGNLDITCRLSELEAQVNTLRQENSMLKESNEELQAQLITHGVEEGRNLLSEASVSHSLAEEFEAMSHNEMRAALKEQQEVNTQLRSYIDGILLNIVENYPQLLEVKTNCTS